MFQKRKNTNFIDDSKTNKLKNDFRMKKIKECLTCFLIAFIIFILNFVWHLFDTKSVQASAVNTNAQTQVKDPAQADILTKAKEMPAFMVVDGITEYTHDELAYKTEKEKGEILSALTNNWDDIWSDQYDYAILVSQKMLKNRNYNKERGYWTYKQYHLYDFSLKLIDGTNYKTMLERLDNKNFDLYREVALLMAADSNKAIASMIYNLYDKFTDGNFTLDYTNDVESKKAFVIAWRIYNGYDDFDNNETGYVWFQYIPKEPIAIAYDQYKKEMEIDNSLMRSANKLDCYSEARSALYEIERKTNPEKEEIYHNITNHYFDFRDYELFADYRVAVAKAAYDNGVNTQSDDFIDFLKQVKMFNYIYAYDKVIRSDFKYNIKSATEELKNMQ